MEKSTLYIVSTPIGNLEDITLRAIRILKEVDLIAAEDTRHTKILLDKYGIHKKLVSFYSYNQLRRKDELINFIAGGGNVALVSDSGTPGISDPGFVLIRSAIEKNIQVIPIPGPTALIAALAVSGKHSNKFVFEGFLSNKASQRRKRLEFLKTEERTVILYESCHRIVKLLGDILEVMGDTDLVVARELTKKFEDVKREKASFLLEHFSKTKPKGEFVVII